MELTATQLKNRFICPILLDKNLSYEYIPDALKEAHKLIDVLNLWWGRRGMQMSYDSISSHIARRYLTNPLMGFEVRPLVDDYYKSFYKYLNYGYANQEIRMEFDKANLYSTIPIVNQTETKGIEIIYLKNLNTERLLLKDVDVRLATIWSFHSFGLRAKIKNVFLDNKEKRINIIEFKPTVPYYESSREVIKSLIKAAEKNQRVFPTSEVCKGCQILETCNK